MSTSSKRSITAIMFGGLGNQMFIYAFARALSLLQKRRLILDVDCFQHDKTYRREFLLDRLAITGSVKPVRPLTWARRAKRALQRRYNCCLPLQWRSLLVEAVPAAFTPALLTAAYSNDNLMVEGYWQSEKYFKQFKPELVRELRCRPVLDLDAQREFDLIRRAKRPVAISLRFFREVPGFKEDIQGKRDLYLSHLREVYGQSPAATFFVFTEEPALARSMFGDELNFIYITHRPANRDGFQNLYLLHHCCEYVIGNSSYHWWGAWLSVREDARVYVLGGADAPNADYFPEEWNLLG